jgi:phosphoglycolate phosphatase
LRTDFDLLVFDLDGTLIDSALDLALAVNATRKHAGLGPIEHQLIYSYVGNGAPMLIKRALGPEASEELNVACLQYFLEYYRDHMLDNTVLYPGVREAVDGWHARDKTMAVLTNKPVRFSEGIVEGLGLSGHFQRVYGGNSFDTKKPDPYGLNLIMEELGFAAEKTLMVGDSSVDVLTARNAGTASAGVTFGLRPEDFKTHPPDILVDDMRDIVVA